MYSNNNRNRSPRPIGLLADPDTDTRELYREWLQANGFDVVQAANGRTAFRLATQVKPALVVTETWLPLLDGFDLCRQLRQHGTTSTVPILVVTADARRATLERSRSLGATVVLTKPVTLDALDQALVAIGSHEASKHHDVAASHFTCAVCGGALEGGSGDRNDARSDDSTFICQRCGLRFVYAETPNGKLRQAG
jgi:DNA-binding response OmpR family regulator